MADLNDQTANISIYPEGSTAPITSTTDGSKERLDVSTGAVVDPSGGMFVIQYLHHKTHEGKLFYWNNYTATINKDATIAWLFKTPSGYSCHTQWTFASSLKGNFTFYENPTVTANGTLQTIFNSNRTSSTTPSALLYLTPTISANGTQLYKSVIGAGKHTGSSGGDTEQFVLKDNEDYYFVYTSEENSNFLSIEFLWYEVAV